MNPLLPSAGRTRVPGAAIALAVILFVLFVLPSGARAAVTQFDNSDRRRLKWWHHI